MTRLTRVAVGPKGQAWDLAQRRRLLPFLRRTKCIVDREIQHWLARGCPSPAPNIVKIDIVKSYVAASRYQRFVETGTYLGSTVEVVARTGVQCHTIELDASLHARAAHILRRYKNIDFVLGDSATQIPQLLEQIHEPTVFWLDGHFSGGVTARAEVETPVGVELEAILAHPLKNHIILIDDAREFTGTGDYPHLSDIIRRIEGDPHYGVEVSTDIIRITPLAEAGLVAADEGAGD